LEEDSPAIMHVRHSERTSINSREERDATLTERGREAAYEFGAKLPKDREYRIYHSSIDRAIETAEEIQEGLRSQETETQLGGVFMKSHHDREKLWDYLTRDCIDVEAENARPFFINWVSNRYPPWEIEPGIIFAQRAAKVIMDNLKTTDSRGFDVYVSHDNTIASFLFYWFGIMLSTDWVQYLDGFIVQLKNARMNVYSKLGKKEVYYPYWWRF